MRPLNLRHRAAVHRLGQTKDVLVKRLVYRDTIEAAILGLHEKLKAGDLAISDGLWPNEAVELICNK